MSLCFFLGLVIRGFSLGFLNDFLNLFESKCAYFKFLVNCLFYSKCVSSIVLNRGFKIFLLYFLITDVSTIGACG